MKSTALKVVYLSIIVIIIGCLMSELYLVIGRRLSGKRVLQSHIYKDNIFTQQPANAMETLWEVPWEKYRANALTEGIIGNNRMTVAINSHGFRTGEFNIRKPEGVYRIIAIGASTTFQGLTNETTYPALLENIMEKKYPHMRFEVLNFGISGSRSDFWINRLDELFKFQPDMIIQYNAVNDITGPYLSRQDNTCINKFRLTKLKTLNISFLYQKLFPLDPSLWDACFKLTFQNFNRIASEAAERDIEYLVSTFAAPDYDKSSETYMDYLDYIVQKTWGKGLYLKYYRSYYRLVNRFNFLLQKFSQQHNINIVNINLSATDPALFTDVCHMTPTGIEIMADTFSKGIIKVLEDKMQ